MRRLRNIHNPLFIPPYLKGDKERIFMLKTPLWQVREEMESKIPLLR
jgi:hypothetical protein